MAGGKHFPSFDPDGDRSWSIYYQRFIFHCKTLKLNSDEERKAEFIACSTDEMFEWTQALCQKCLSDETLTFQNICTTIEAHIKEPDNEIRASSVFHARSQQVGESIRDFVAELRRLARPCNFGAALERTLRDRIVLGISCLETRALLFRTKKEDLTVDKVIEIARSVEASQEQAHATATVNNSNGINYVARSSGPAPRNSNNNSAKQQTQPAAQRDTPRPCKCCDGTDGHSPSECRYRESVCDYCSITGHIQRACRRRKRDMSKPQSSNSGGGGGGSGSKNHNKRHFRKQGNPGVHHAAQHTATPGGMPNAKAPPGPAHGPVPQAQAQYFEPVYDEYDFAFHYAAVSQRLVSLHHVAHADMALNLPPPELMTVSVDGAPIEFELDNGCPISLINEQLFQKRWPGKQLQPIPFQLSTWTAEAVALKGYFMASVQYQNHLLTLPLFVGSGLGRALMGRQWFQPMAIRVTKDAMEAAVLHASPAAPGPAAAPGAALTPPEQPAVPSPPPPAHRGSPTWTEAMAAIPTPLREYSCFREELGRYTGEPIKISMLPTARPVHGAVRKVPFPRRTLVGEGIDDNISKEVWKGPLDWSEWATPIVPVFRPGKPPRLCADYRTTLNPHLAPVSFPMPTMEESFACLAGNVVFSKLDLKDAYLQVPVDEESARLLTVTTHKGLFSVHRLPFGLATAPILFQRLLTGLLRGIDGVVIWLDDILVAARQRGVHDDRLREVLRRLSDAGLRLHPTKCTLYQSCVEYLGHRVDTHGITPLESKVLAVLKAPPPTDVSQLSSFIGKLNFYDRFFEDRATKLEPLYRLLEKNKQWVWGEAEQAAFEAAKHMLASTKLLVHYDLEKEVIVCCDASPYGLGAVLAHRYPDGSERPIEYASRTLNAAERNYSQTDREALAIIFAVIKWHQFLAGRRFVIVTDRKPLLGIFGQHRTFPQVLSPRMERWLLTLGCYAYELVWRPGKDHGNADALSRLPLPGSNLPIAVHALSCLPVPGPEMAAPEPPGIFLLTGSASPHLQADEVAAASLADPTLSKILDWTRHGWPAKDPGGNVSPYFKLKDAISCVRDCLLWGNRVIIPAALHGRALRHVHAAHMGIVRTKALARLLFWWPGLTKDIERLVETCAACQATRARAPRLPVTPWPSADAPWSRLHVDFAGPFMNKHFLVLVDSFSGWMDVFPVQGPTTEEAIRCLTMSFRYNGLPFTLVSDNGAAFTSHRFREFCIQRGVKQLYTAPRNPASNGRAERMVRTVKDILRRLPDNADLQSKLDVALESLRTAPGPDGRSPAERLMGRQVRTSLSLVRPAPKSQVPAVEHHFSPGETVWYQRHGNKTWQPATVSNCMGRVMVVVHGDDGNQATRHVNQIRRRAPQASLRPALKILTYVPDMPGGLAPTQDQDNGENEQEQEQPRPEPSPPRIPKRRSFGRGIPMGHNRTPERKPGARATRNPDPRYKF